MTTGHHLRRIAGVMLIVIVMMSISGRSQAEGGIFQKQFAAAGWYLRLEILDDDLVHFQYSPAETDSIGISPMIFKTDYAGASAVTEPEPGIIETPQLRLEIDDTTLCMTLNDHSETLTTICPLESDETAGLTLSREGTTDVYGLGEQFRRADSNETNWVGARRIALDAFGNAVGSYNSGNVGNAQFPVMYALAENTNYALFLDDAYAQTWDFMSDPFAITTTDSAVRGYLMTGSDLPDLRHDFMELTGHPPVPPRQMFGLWVSEYGYENWRELVGVLASLQAADFPIDGFVLDLQWFGDIRPLSQMGGLAWDTRNFPDPAGFIAALRANDGISLMTIEESYVSDALPDYDALAAQGILVRECEALTCEPVHFQEWWGRGGMVDWTNPDAAAWWHDNRRQHLVDDGIIAHWTDLGEPEDYNKNAWYFGVDGQHDEAAVHNLYNFLWAQSIADGYARHEVSRRLFILSRSGTAGMQRFGAAMWSGDIGANMASLDGQMPVQMNMSLSGIDYFGSDVGGFNRGAADRNIDEDTMYTLWLANSALLDVPLRPHTFNLRNDQATAPSLIGDVDSNLANVRLRYELSPYLYTLAHRAYRDGDPVFAPLVYYFQSDPATRPLGTHKMLGDALLMVSATGEDYAIIPVYLPAGGWFNYHTHEFIDSAGAWQDVPTDVDGFIRAPLFARDGAIIPQMETDDPAHNLLRPDTALVFTVFRHSAASGSFTLIEDDGESTAYQSGAVRETALSFVATAEKTTVSIAAASGTYEGAPEARRIEIRLVTNNPVAAVQMNGDALPMLTAPDQNSAGWWVSAPGMVSVNVPSMAVDTAVSVDIVTGE